MTFTKATILTWFGNIATGLLVTGGAWAAFFDQHYRGIGAICVIIGLIIQWRFKVKAHQETKRHNETIENIRRQQANG